MIRMKFLCGFDCKDGAQSALSQLVIDDDDKPRPLPTIAGISCDMVASVVCWCVWGLVSITCPKGTMAKTTKCVGQ